MSAGIIVNESPSAFREFASFGFAFYRGGTCGCGDQIREIRFGNRAFETGEVATDQGDYFLGGELVPETWFTIKTEMQSNPSRRSVWWHGSGDKKRRTVSSKNQES